MADENGQAGINSAEAFLRSRQENPLRLRFDSRDDALAHAQAFGERARERFIKRWVPIFENYLRDRLEYVVDVDPATCQDCPFSEAYKFNLVFSSVPFANIESSRPRKLSEVRSIDYHVTACGDAHDALMFIGSGQTEKLVKRGVAAFARIEILNERFEIGVNALQSSLAFRKEVLGCLPNGKVYPTRVFPSEQNCAVTNGLVERVLAITDDMRSFHPERVWERVLQLAVKDSLFGGNIKIYSDGTQAVFKKRIGQLLDFRNGFFQAAE